MTIHVAKDTGCNLSCDYCYQEEDRSITINNVSSQSLDIDAVMEQLEEWKETYPNEVPGLHGGEPLLIDIEDLETIFKWVYDNYETVRTGNDMSHIQTNGTMINDDHIEMFRKYNVNVGISCDGPVELNRNRTSRYSDGSDATDKMSERTLDNIMKCAKTDGVSCGIIVVAHRGNAGDDEKIDTLLEWIDELNQNDVWGHYNPAIPYEDIQTELSLSGEELKHLYLRTWEWMKEEPYRRWNPMASYRDNLIGAQLTNCVNRQCDVFNAGAAKIVTGEGYTTGCGKTWSAVGDGVPFLQGASNDSEYDSSPERYEMLKQTPGPYTDGEPDMGGCKGCKYWNVCAGGCPSSGLDGDFRNRTRWCEAKYALYEAVERDMRIMFPNITLITDYPWNANLAEQAGYWGLDIKPFAAMDPGISGRSSTFGGYEHPFGGPLDRVDDVMPDGREEQLEFAKDAFPEEHLTYDEETFDWHADSAMTEKGDDE